MNDEKLIIFDWGGVIESHNNNEYNVYKSLKSIMNYFNIDLELDELITKYESCSIDELGRSIGTYNDMINIEKWFNRVKNAFNINCTFQEFCEIYKRENIKIHYYKEVVDFILSIRNDCKIAILSNLISLDKERLDYQVNLSKFDYVWLSFELGYIKPDEKIYEVVEKECRIDPGNILFVDDTKKNLDIAKKRGWNTCLAMGLEIDKIKNTIYKFLNK